MGKTIPLPKDNTRPAALADWLEICSLIDKDRTASINDLIAELKSFNNEEDIEPLVESVLDELDLRKRYLSEKYPFALEERSLLRAVKNEKLNWAYVFCLLVSFIGSRPGEALKIWKNEEISHLFEVLSSTAAENYLSQSDIKSECICFGAEKSKWSKSHKKFSARLVGMKDKLSEGNVRNFLKENVYQQDGGLDVISWRHFSEDKRPGKLILLGQCSISKDGYIEKAEKRELDKFLDYYFEIQGSYIKGFFLPHFMSESDSGYSEDWKKIYISIGIVFDRSRIAQFANNWTDSKVPKILSVATKALLKADVSF